MFRIAAQHSDPEHPNAAVFQVGGPFDSPEDAYAALPAAAERFPLAEGYQLEVQGLRVDGDVGEWVTTSSDDDVAEATP